MASIGEASPTLAASTLRALDSKRCLASAARNRATSWVSPSSHVRRCTTGVAGTNKVKRAPESRSAISEARLSSSRAGGGLMSYY